MLKDDLEQNILRAGSTTYYWSAKLFPRAIRDDVLKLYSFVRIADDYVDSVPQQGSAFRDLRKAWSLAKTDPHFDTCATPIDTVDQRVIKNMIYLTNTYAFDPTWAEAFLDSMQSDLDGKTYETLDDTLAYMYGSAEVVGLMMAKIMSLAPESYETARMLGRAMQYVNFIRDIDEDIKLGRNYFPLAELRLYGMHDLRPDTAHNNPAAYNKYIHAQLQRYREWQHMAEVGYRYMPVRMRVPVKAAADMYKWTALQIARDPLAVYQHKIKPSRVRIILSCLTTIIR